MCVRTKNVHHGEAVVEGHADEEPADAELPEGGGEGGGDAGGEAHQVGADERGDAAVAVGHPAEQQPAADGAQEENRLRPRRQTVSIAHPFHLRAKIIQFKHFPFSNEFKFYIVTAQFLIMLLCMKY